jgi:murein DD-endopeptidase
MDRMQSRPSLTEILGVSPWRDRLREARLALRGDSHTPPSRFDLTSLQILQPALSFQLWRGHRPFGRLVPLYNLFNRSPTPEADGWSVRKRQVTDFRGGTLTYDSHNGTDFATPPGTIVVAPAAGRVAKVISEFNRGGLKVMIDHGDGLCTTAGHLARSLVEVGAEVARGEPIAMSGASGLNFLGSLLADPPHVHFNVWLDGVPIDPFARTGEVPIWLAGNTPAPNDELFDDGAPSSDFDDDKVEAWIDACTDAALAVRLTAISDPWLRACETMFAANYYPTRFGRRVNPYATAHPRLPRLDLPFAAADYDGVVFPDA